jgi:hypothetical protein
MAKLLVSIAAAAIVLVASAARAQTPPGTTARVNLTLEQTHVIRELIKELKIEPAKTASQPSVGDVLPKDVTLRPMPSEIGQKVPQIKAHSFLVTEKQIVIVDPKDNQVAELIDLKAN